MFDSDCYLIITQRFFVTKCMELEYDRYQWFYYWSTNNIPVLEIKECQSAEFGTFGGNKLHSILIFSLDKVCKVSLYDVE